MCDDGRRRAASGGRIALVLAVALSSAPAQAQRLGGLANVRYENLERAGTLPTQETWGKTFELHYSNSLPSQVELQTRLRFTEQSIVGRADRLRIPEGSLQLAHRNFGFTSAFRPTETRDSRSQTLRQQNLSLTGYAQKPGLPSLSGSWIRTHLDPSPQSPASATVARSVGGTYNLPHLATRAGYGDRLQENQSGHGARTAENHVNLGATSQFQVVRAPFTLQYDYRQSRANPTGLRSQTSRGHTAGAASSLQLSSRTSTSLAYTYNRTEGVGAGALTTELHNGSLTLSHLLRPGLETAGGAGVRSATFGGQSETERFLTASASAHGEARPGWRLAASASHSLNWLPGSGARPTDTFQSNTNMQLAPGLAARGDFAISSSRRALAPSDSALSPREVALVTGAAVTASPLRTLYLEAGIRRSRTGASLRGVGASVTSYATTLRITPVATLQILGGWSLADGGASRGTTTQATMQWSPGRLLQVSGAYNRSSQQVSSQIFPIAALQEGFSGTLATALGRDLTGSFRYSDSNRGQPTHVRQMSVDVVQRFGR